MANPWDNDKVISSGNPWDNDSVVEAPKPKGSVSQIPAAVPGLKNSNVGRAAAPKPEEAGILDKLQGLGEVGLSALSGAVAAPAGAVRGALGSLTSGQFGTQAGVQKGEKEGSQLAESLTYTPKTAKGQEYGAALADFFKDAGLEALGGLGGETSAIASAASASKPLAAAAASKAGQGIGKAAQTVAQSKVGQGVGAAAGAVGDAAGAAKSAVGRGLAKAAGVQPETLALAQKAKGLGIDIRPDQVTNNKILKMVGEALEKVPLSGSKVEARQEAFNKALIRQIGGDEKATKLNPEVYDKALTKAGNTIGSIGEKSGVKVDTPTGIALNNIVEDAKKFQTNDVAKVLENYGKELNSKTKDGLLDGTAFRKLNSKIGNQARTTSNGDLKQALGELQDVLHDALGNTLTGKELKDWDKARQYYAKAKVLEPLVAKSKTGDISGPSLMARVTADKAGKTRMARGQGGELGDLARIGQLLKEPESSGTAERGIAYGLLGGGAFANPGAAAGVYGAANLYNRLGGYLIPPPPRVP